MPRIYALLTNWPAKIFQALSTAAALVLAAWPDESRKWVNVVMSSTQTQSVGFALLAIVALLVLLRLYAGRMKPISGPEGDLARVITLQNAIMRSLTGEWHQPFSRLTDNDQLFLVGSRLKEFETLARNGAITFWGAPHVNLGVGEKLPADLWSEQQVKHESLLLGDACTEYFSSKGAYQYGRFYRLGVDREDIERIWPLSRWRRIRMFFARKIRLS